MAIFGDPVAWEVLGWIHAGRLERHVREGDRVPTEIGPLPLEMVDLLIFAPTDLHEWSRNESTVPGVYFASAGEDIHYAGAGDDLFVVSAETAPGGYDYEHFDGGPGIDTVRIETTEVLSFFASDHDGSGPSSTLPPDRPALPMRFTSVERFEVSGSDGDDSFDGGAGRDMLDGSAGDDALDGGGGDDALQGGPGRDALRGGAFHDRIDGGTEADTLRGETGDDTLNGEDGADRLFGGRGDDRLFGGAMDDVMHGGSGRDFLRGEEGDDTAYGGIGDDELDGRGGDDLLFGGPGDDIVVGADGIDTLHGGPGDDRMGDTDAAAATGARIEMIFGGPGDDRINFEGSGLRAIFGGPGDDRILLDDASPEGATIEGGAGDDIIRVAAPVGLDDPGRADVFVFRGDWGRDSLEMRLSEDSHDAVHDRFPGTIVLETGGSEARSADAFVAALTETPRGTLYDMHDDGMNTIFFHGLTAEAFAEDAFVSL